MKVCPRCGYKEPIMLWRSAYSRGMEVEYASFEDVELYNPVLAKHLKEATPNKRGLREFQDEFYAYGLWKSNYVRRRDLDIWKVQRWKAIPMEKHKPAEVTK